MVLLCHQKRPTRTTRLQGVLWEALEMKCLYYTEWCECPDCELHRMGIEMFDFNGLRLEEEE